MASASSVAAGRCVTSCIGAFSRLFGDDFLPPLLDVGEGGRGRGDGDREAGLDGPASGSSSEVGSRSSMIRDGFARSPMVPAADFESPWPSIAAEDDATGDDDVDEREDGLGVTEWRS